MPAQGLFLMIGAHPRTDWLPPEIARRLRLRPDRPDLGEDCGWPLERTRSCSRRACRASLLPATPAMAP